MRLLITCNTLPSLGGVGTFVNNLAKGLRRLGHDVDVVSVFGVSPGFKVVRATYIRTALLLLRPDIFLVTAYRATQQMLGRRVGRALRSKRYDAVLAQDVCSSNATRAGTLSRGIPLILTMHGYVSKEGVANRPVRPGSGAERFLLREERRAFETADHILVVTQKGASHVRSLAASVEKLDVIRIPVDTSLFAPSEDRRSAERKRWGIAENALVVLYAGRLVRRKGVVYAILAMQDIIKRQRDAKLVIVGDGPEAGTLAAAVRERGLGNHVLMTGPLPPAEMPAVYNMADVLVVPSVSQEGEEEGSPCTVIEAMASGVPVAAFPVGGLQELIDHGKTGLLSAERDPPALAEAILHLAENPDMRRRITEAAMAGALERHSDTAVAGEIAGFCSLAVDRAAYSHRRE